MSNIYSDLCLSTKHYIKFPIHISSALWFVLVLGNIILNSTIKVTIFHKKASTQHYLINVLSAVIRSFVPVWIDGVICLCVGVYKLDVVRTKGGRVHLQPRPPEISFLNVI